jgi:ribonuclease HII
MVTVGIDEVGRGCWAGPLVAGAVILTTPIVGLKDSKKLMKKQREKLAAEIQINALAVGLGWVSPAEIDDIGLTASVRLAMGRALEKITTKYDEIIIDGSFNFLSGDPRSKAVIKADDSIAAVSAASIVAKVARDQWMHEASATFPGYGFDQHVGYGTKLHLEKLKVHGICSLHRLSYKPVRAIAGLAD